MPPRSAPRGLALAALLLACSAAPAVAAPAVTGEFPVSALETDNKLVEGPDGNEWVTLSDPAKNVARITPAGAVKEYELGAAGTTGIAVAAGKLWITRAGGITSFEASDPEGTKAATEIPGIAASDPIVLGPDGNLWVAASNALVRISPSEPNTSKSFPVAELTPKDVDVAGSLLVIANAGTLPGTAGVVTATLSDPPLTSEVKFEGAPQGVAGGPGGQVAYTQPTKEPKELGLFTLPALAPQKIQLPGTDPFGIVLAQDGAYWSAEGNGDRLLRLTTTGQVSALPGFAAGSRPTQISTGAGGTLWVTLSMAAKVARVSGVEAPAPSSESESGGSSGPGFGFHPPPETEILSGPGKRIATANKKIRVAFRFFSPQAGSGFECRLLRSARTKKPRHERKANGHRKGGGHMVKERERKAKASAAAAPPPFRACSSPRGYELGPGRYGFEVRAVLDGSADPTPARRPFRVVFSP